MRSNTIPEIHFTGNAQNQITESKGCKISDKHTEIYKF